MRGMMIKTKTLKFAAILTVCCAIWGLVCHQVAVSQVPGIFSTIQWTTASGTSVGLNYAALNGQPGSYSGTNGYVAYGKNGTGDMDFVAANGGSSPSFYWYSLTGVSTLTAAMWVDQSNILHEPQGATFGKTTTTSVSTGNYTFSTIPSASTIGAGSIVYITDCTSYAVGALSVCVGGGSDKMMALSDGTNWTVH